MRWTAKAKARIVGDVRAGMAPRAQLLEVWGIGVLEYLEWERAFEGERLRAPPRGEATYARFDGRFDLVPG